MTIFGDVISRLQLIVKVVKSIFENQKMTAPNIQIHTYRLTD